MSRARPRISPKQRNTLAGACLGNALDLLSEAMILLDNERVPRAVFLTLVSLEETLKSRYCQLAPTDDWGEFWTGFRDHATKLGNADEYLGEAIPDGLVETLVKMRERCLYVEVHHDGRTLTPPGLVDPGGLDSKIVRGWILWLTGIDGRLKREWRRA
jgi:AbiV family abortive infection protein